MKFISIYTLIALLSGGVLYSGWLLPHAAKQDDPKYQPDKFFFQAKDLYERGLPQQALDQLNLLEKLAKNQKDTLTLFKVLIHRSYYDGHLENADEQWIQQMQRMIPTLNAPLNSMAQSFLAQAFIDYSQTKPASKFSSTSPQGSRDADFRNWDHHTFLFESMDLLERSLEPDRILCTTPVKNYTSLFNPISDSTLLEPSFLMDVLALRAIHLYAQISPRFSPRPEHTRINQSIMWKPDQYLLKLPPPQDATDIWPKVFRIWQRWMSSAACSASSVHAQTIRLEYFLWLKSQWQGDQAEIFFQEALKEMMPNLSPSDPFYGITLLHLARSEGQTAQEVESPKDATIQQMDRALARLEEVIQGFPNTHISMAAMSQRDAFLRSQLNGTVSRYVMPNEPIQASLQFRSLKSVYVYVFKVNESIPEYLPEKEWIQIFQKMEMVRRNEMNLRERIIAVNLEEQWLMPPLEIGQYVWMVSTEPIEKTKNKEPLLWAPLQVTEMISITRSIKPSKVEARYLDRDRGTPLSNLSVQVRIFNYDYRSQREEVAWEKTFKTDKEGRLMVDIPNQYTNKRITLTAKKGKDELDTKVYVQDRYRRPEKEMPQAVFFTDRAIYRPGETVQFKMILIKFDGLIPKPITGQKIRWVAKDASGKIFQKGDLISNEFGSASASVSLPSQGLNGWFHLGTDFGSVGWQVEAYQRPSFEIVIPKDTQTYRLMDTVSSTVTVKTYHGLPVPSARIQVKVVRRMFRPYWWRGWYPMPASDAEISYWEGTTDANGLARFPVYLWADSSGASQTLYHFDAEITAIAPNGESQNNTMRWVAGSQSVFPTIEGPEHLYPWSRKPVAFFIKNAAGENIDQSASVTLTRLIPPDGLEIPALPFPYRTQGSSDYSLPSSNSWSKGRVVREMEVRSGEEWAASVWKDVPEGFYLLTLSSYDSKLGKQVQSEHHLGVWGQKGSAFSAPWLFFADVSESTFSVGDTIRLILASQGRQVHYDIEWLLGDQIIKKQKKIVSRERTVIEEVVPLHWQGGVAVRITAIRHNRLIQKEFHFDIPFKDEPLKLEWTSLPSKVEPGKKQSWGFTITDASGKPVQAEITASIYDESLDTYRPHQFPDLSYRKRPMLIERWNIQSSAEIQAMRGRSQSLSEIRSFIDIPHFRIRELIPVEVGYGHNPYAFTGRGTKVTTYIDGVSVQLKGARSQAGEEMNESLGIAQAKDAQEDGQNSASPETMVRENLQATALFEARLRSDAQGKGRLEFTLPEALTRWKLLFLAHDGFMRTVMFTHRAEAYKPLTVKPLWPRIIRSGDDFWLQGMIYNASAETLKVQTFLNLTDVYGKSRSEWIEEGIQTLKDLLPGQAVSVSWKVRVPVIQGAMIAQMSAKSDSYSDGESQILTILPGSMLMTETIAMQLNGKQEKRYQLAALQKMGQHQPVSLTLEYTAQPLWHIIYALPYLTTQTPESPDVWAQQFYANGLTLNVLQQIPQAGKWLEAMEREGSMNSPLLANDGRSLGGVGSSPWWLDAVDEQSQRRRLFWALDQNRAERDQAEAWKKLWSFQLPEGGFSWYPGMRCSPLVTQKILELLGKSRRLKIWIDSHQESLTQALHYTDRMMKDRYDDILKMGWKKDQRHIGYEEFHYLYMRSFFQDVSLAKGTEEAITFFNSQALKYAKQSDLIVKAWMAVAFIRQQQLVEADHLLQSLLEFSNVQEEEGRYWKANIAGFSWHQSSLKTHTHIIEAFLEAGKHPKAQQEMMLWLMRHKRTNRWQGAAATAEACYVIWQMSGKKIPMAELPNIYVGDQRVLFGEEEGKIGTGFVQKSWIGKDIHSGLSNIRLEGKAEGYSYGGVFYTYESSVEAVKASPVGAVQIKREIYIVKNSAKGEQWELVGKETPIRIGDELLVRLKFEVDRSMMYVHVKDGRAMALEPGIRASGYQWNLGLGYYESIQDDRQDFYIESLPKGRHQIEYRMRMTHAGTFRVPPVQLQCYYAPELSANGEGMILTVSK